MKCVSNVGVRGAVGSGERVRGAEVSGAAVRGGKRCVARGELSEE